MKNSEERIYRTFEEFEREELRRTGAADSSVDDIMERLFADDLDFEASGGRRKSTWDDDEE